MIRNSIVFADPNVWSLKNICFPLLDQGNEELRAQINALKYELDSLQQERELSELRHEKEVREIRSKAEADFRRAQVCSCPFLRRKKNKRWHFAFAKFLC